MPSFSKGLYIEQIFARTHCVALFGYLPSHSIFWGKRLCLFISSLCVMIFCDWCTSILIQDAIIRWLRMSGYNALWVPGMDRAGIATQVLFCLLGWSTKHKYGTPICFLCMRHEIVCFISKSCKANFDLLIMGVVWLSLYQYFIW